MSHSGPDCRAGGDNERGWGRGQMRMWPWVSGPEGAEAAGPEQREARQGRGRKAPGTREPGLGSRSERWRVLWGCEVLAKSSSVKN
jgi:hypothetical protein